MQTVTSKDGSRIAYDRYGSGDLARLRRVRDRIDREYAQPLDVEALARGAHSRPTTCSTSSPGTRSTSTSRARPASFFT
jgi:hypothetical protein